MNSFQRSKYLEIIEIIGNNIAPISYSDLKKKTGFNDSTLSRTLNWLQDLDKENTQKKKIVEAYLLKKEKYIEAIGINKSKNNAYRLSNSGINLFNSEFVEKKDVIFIDELIRDYKIYEKLWNFVNQNRILYFKQFSIDNEYDLEPWTEQLFGIFENINENDLEQIIEKITGPKNLRIFNFFQILIESILKHPVWIQLFEKKNIKFPDLKLETINIIKNIPIINDNIQFFGEFPKIYCLFKSDKLIEKIYTLIPKYLKIFYWKEMVHYAPEGNIIGSVVNKVFNDLYEGCPEYLEFLNDFHLEISLYVKRVVREQILSSKEKLKYPLKLMPQTVRENFNFHLRRKIFQSNIDNIPSNLINLGASKEIIKEQIKDFKLKCDKTPNNIKLKMKLLELLVYNYSHEFQSDLDFYEDWDIDIRSFTEDLIEDLTHQNSKFQESSLILGYIFYNQKFFDVKKAIEISENLLNYYPQEESLFENLAHLYFTQEKWDLKKIELLINHSLELFPINSYFLLSKIILRLIKDDNYIYEKEFRNKIQEITSEFNSKELINKIIFFQSRLKKQGLVNISLEFLKFITKIFPESELELILAEQLTNQGKYAHAIKIYLKLIDNFPNRFLETKVLNNFRFLSISKEHDKIFDFLQEIIEILKIINITYEWQINKSNITNFNNRRAEFFSELKSCLNRIKPLLNNPFCATLPLKLKAIILKALSREKNLESCLLKIIRVNSNNLWAIRELGILYFNQERLDKGTEYLDLVEHIKKHENFPIPFHLISNYSHFLEDISYDLVNLYIKAGKYREPILLIEDFLTDTSKRMPINVNAQRIATDLIYCYHMTMKDIDKVIYIVLKIIEKIDVMEKDEESYTITIDVQRNPFYFKQALIDFLYDKNQYKKSLKYILKFNAEDARFLDLRVSFFRQFNINNYYLAECYLTINDLKNSKYYYEKALQELNEDITHDIRTNLWLINPFPDYLKSQDKRIYEKYINKGLKKINLILKKENKIDILILKTDVRRSIGNISLLINERSGEQKNLLEEIQNQLNKYPSDEKLFYQLIVACSCAINGYLDEMKDFISDELLVKNYPTISSLLNILYSFYSDSYTEFIGFNTKLRKLIPNSSIPLLFDLHYLRFKEGLSKLKECYDLFKEILSIRKFNGKVYGIEGKIFDYLRKNLLWYPFQWALKFERLVRNQTSKDIENVIEIVNFINNKKINHKKELMEFITRIITTERNFDNLLNVLLTSPSYNYPTTRYEILKKIELKIDIYDYMIYGEIFDRTNKMKENISQIEKIRADEFNQLRNKKYINFNKKKLQINDKYLNFLLKLFNFHGKDDWIEKKIREYEKIESFPKEKILYYKILLDLRSNNYYRADLNAERLLYKFLKEINQKWDDNYFKVFIVSRVLYQLKTQDFFNHSELIKEVNDLTINNVINKSRLDLLVILLSTLSHELFKYKEINLSTIKKDLFKELVEDIYTNDKKSINRVAEIIVYNRDLFYCLSIDSINEIKKLIENLDFNENRSRFYIIYLTYLIAIIYQKSNKIKEAKNTVENLLKKLNDEEIFRYYYELNDLYLELNQ